MLIKIIIILFVLIYSFSLRSEPWIDTRDQWLRSDIEMLSDAGIIKVPITTYPLMWSGIIRDIDDTDIRYINTKYKQVFWRVKKLGKIALTQKSVKELRISLASSEQILRSFGDESRGQSELAARSYNINGISV